MFVRFSTDPHNMHLQGILEGLDNPLTPTRFLSNHTQPFADDAIFYSYTFDPQTYIASEQLSFSSLVTEQRSTMCVVGRIQSGFSSE